ncbi:hypothetical protein KIN20_019412 [Parelaphostrongylus tenuis]|uniref:Uncharacterized protein n=1 Tax=Parelaphostrongylus tenuis TaxID=148309 RepID=A0AAD5MPI2_PARTN|nr:hypothetical protein KIN20_019412 [Parelaphostrongylus tenuis]
MLRYSNYDYGCTDFSILCSNLTISYDNRQVALDLINFMRRKIAVGKVSFPTINNISRLHQVRRLKSRISYGERVANKDKISYNERAVNSNSLKYDDRAANSDSIKSTSAPLSATTTRRKSTDCPSTTFSSLRETAVVRGLTVNAEHRGEFAPPSSRKDLLNFDCYVEAYAHASVRSCSGQKSPPFTRPGYQENVHVLARTASGSLGALQNVNESKRDWIEYLHYWCSAQCLLWWFGQLQWKYWAMLMVMLELHVDVEYYR